MSGKPRDTIKANLDRIESDERAGQVRIVVAGLDIPFLQIANFVLKIALASMLVGFVLAVAWTIGAVVLGLPGLLGR